MKDTRDATRDTPTQQSKMLIAFLDVIRHLNALKRQNSLYICVLEMIAVILVVK